MAIQGRFEADFEQFSSAVKAAEVQLRGFESSSAKVESQLSRMTNAFSGNKVIQDATLMAEAVDRVGGVSKLTERELARVSATVGEAAAKLRAMGLDVPPQLQKIADATKGASTATSSWSSALGTVNSLLGAFGVAVSVAGLVRFVGGVFDAASGIHDMSLKLGISAEAVQGFQFAAEQAGSTLDAVGTAITRMNVNLSEGDKGTVGALTKVGLQFHAIRAMKPEDAFLAITDAIAQIPDPMTRSEVALQLFGKSAAELLPAIAEGFRETSDSASKMSNETITSLERAQDAWAKAGNAFTIVTGGMIAKAIEFWDTLRAQNFGGFGVAVEDLAKDIELLPPVLHRTAEELKALAEAEKKAADEMARLQKIADSLIGQPFIDGARDMLAAIGSLTERGLEPMRSKWDDIVKVLNDAMAAMEETGKVGTRMYEELAAAAERFTVKVLPSTPLGTGANALMPAPTVGGSQGVATSYWQSEIDALERYESDIAEIDAMVNEFHESQMAATEAALTGADAASKSYEKWARAVGAVNTEFEVLLDKSFDVVKAYEAAGLVATAPAIGGDRMRPGYLDRQPQQVITINAQNSFYDTPSGQQAFFERFGKAALQGAR
jgi:hypothetical protein